MPGAIEATVRNLREIAPTWYFNVPKGYEVLLPYLRSRRGAATRISSRRLKVLWFAGAGVAAARVRRDEGSSPTRPAASEILFLTGLGSTETAPYAMGRMWETRDVTNMGLPPPGVEMKLVPAQDKLEARLKGPNITPGYWRQPELTAQAFDEEGYYRLGDAFVFADDDDPEEGLLFRGRIAEDFKLSTGTWVQVGPLRARLHRALRAAGARRGDRRRGPQRARRIGVSSAGNASPQENSAPGCRTLPSAPAARTASRARWCSRSRRRSMPAR